MSDSKDFLALVQAVAALNLEIESLQRKLAIAVEALKTYSMSEPFKTLDEALANRHTDLCKCDKCYARKVLKEIES